MKLASQQILELRKDLRVAQVRILDEAEKIASKGALNIKNGMAAQAAANTPKGYARHVPRSFSYDMTREGSTVHARIGTHNADGEDGNQAALYGFMAFGRRDTAPVLDHAVPLEAEAPLAAEFLVQAGRRLLS